MSSEKELKINHEIQAKEVRLIDENGEMLGIMPLFDAINKAAFVDLDLVEISPNTVPPICKITNYGKLKYQNQKKIADAKKKQKVVKLKEVKLSLNIGIAELNTKIKQTRGFLEDGNKVKFNFKFRGREIIFADQVKEILNKIVEDTKDIAKVDTEAKMEGKKLFFVLSSTVKK